MASLTDFLPILIGLIAFIIKIISDENKKQPGKQGKSTPSYKRNSDSPAEAKVEKPTKKVWNGYRWVDVLIEDQYQSLDPALVPKDLPDIDYDKMTNVSVPKGNETAPVTIIEKIEQVENAKLSAIKKKFKEKNRLKELYLLSEILNKPKAYRKWQRNIF